MSLISSLVLESTSLARVDVPQTTLTIAKPSGTVSGDFLLAFILKDDDDAITGVPSGWATVEDDVGGTACRCACYSLVAGGSEPADYTWTGDSEEWVGFIVRMSGQHGTPVNASDVATGTTTPATFPAVTPTVDQCLIFRFVGWDQAATAGTESFFQGFFNRNWMLTATLGNNSAGFDASALILQGGAEEQLVAGSTGTPSYATASGSNEDWVAITVAIRPLTAGVLNGGGGGEDNHAFFG